jgi:hypothetical protein
VFSRQRDHVAAREGAREPDGGGGHVGPVLGELDHLGRRHELDHPLGQLELERRRAGEVRAQRELRGRGLDDARVGVPQHDRAQPHAPVQELAAVGVLDPAALPGHDERRRVGRELVVALAVGVAAGGDGAMRPPAQRRLRGVEHRAEASIRRR